MCVLVLFSIYVPLGTKQNGKIKRKEKKMRNHQPPQPNRRSDYYYTTRALENVCLGPSDCHHIVYLDMCVWDVGINRMFLLKTIRYTSLEFICFDVSSFASRVWCASTNWWFVLFLSSSTLWNHRNNRFVSSAKKITRERGRERE